MYFPLRLNLPKRFLDELKLSESQKAHASQLNSVTSNTEPLASESCFIHRFNNAIEARSIFELKSLHRALSAGLIHDHYKYESQYLTHIIEHILTATSQAESANQLPATPLPRSEIIKQIEIATATFITILSDIFTLTPPVKSALEKTIITFKKQGSKGESKAGVNNGNPHIIFSISPIETLQAINPDFLKFDEYVSLEKVQDIGSCTGSVYVYLSAMVAHELAHVIQRTLTHGTHRHQDEFWNGISIKSLRKPHGKGWQEIYSKLRVAVTNQLPTYQKTK